MRTFAGLTAGLIGVCWLLVPAVVRVYVWIRRLVDRVADHWAAHRSRRRQRRIVKRVLSAPSAVIDLALASIVEALADAAEELADTPPASVEDDR